MSPDRWILQVFDPKSFIHICKNVLGALIPTFIIGVLSHICQWYTSKTNKKMKSHYDLNSFIHMM
jgi:hypothetical protein